MANELNIFDVSSETPTDAWAHGSAAAKAWVTGSLRAEDELDLSAEFDAKFSAKFSADALKGLASLSGDLTGAAHAGVRLQAGMPLDLFEAAGIIARLRLEASANVRASVTAAMGVGEMRALVTGALPAESRPYVDIVLDEVRVGATVWARASFAAMAISELMAAIDLFPEEGPAGVTAYFHYGFGWGYGAGWGVITNVGFDLKGMLRRMSDQAELDLRAALEAFRTAEGLAPNSEGALATELAEILLPLTLDAVVSWCEQRLDPGDDEQLPALGDSLAEAVRTLLADAILPRLLSFAGEKVIENVAHVPAEEALEIWGQLAAASVYLAGTSDDLVEAVEAAAIVLNEIAEHLPEDVGKPLGSAVRCAAAIVALASDSADTSQKVQASLVLTEELATLLVDEGLIPAWIEPLFDSLETVIATLASDSGNALTTDQAVDLLHSLLTVLEELMNEKLVNGKDLWDWLATETGFPALVQSMKAQTHVLIELCASLKNGDKIDGHATREAVSVAIIMLIGQPLAQVISTVAERGLAEVPPALRALADEVDQSSSPTSIDAGWDDLAKQVVGSSVGFPVAQLLRHAAGTAAQWRDTRLPAELAMLRNFLELDLADEFAANGPTAAVHEFKKELLPILGKHVIDVVLTSHEFILRDSVNLFRDMVTGTVQHILRSLELSAIISFRLVEEAVELLEQGVSELQQREIALEQEAERHTAEFFTALSDVTRAHPGARRLRRGGAHRLDCRAVHGACRRGPDAELDSRRAQCDRDRRGEHLLRRRALRARHGPRLHRRPDRRECRGAAAHRGEPGGRPGRDRAAAEGARRGRPPAERRHPDRLRHPEPVHAVRPAEHPHRARARRHPGARAVVDRRHDHLRKHRPRAAHRDAQRHRDEPAGDEGRARDGAQGDRGDLSGGDAPEPASGAARRAARDR